MKLSRLAGLVLVSGALLSVAVAQPRPQDATTTSDKQLKHDEKSNKEQAKADKEQRKAMKAKAKADKAAAKSKQESDKAGTSPS